MSKKVILGFKSISAGDASASINGTATDVLYMNDIAYQFVWTGTPTGTLAVQGSNDNVNWDSIGTTSGNPAGSAGHSSIAVANVGHRYVRPVYTFTSGAGTITVTLVAKEK